MEIYDTILYTLFLVIILVLILFPLFQAISPFESYSLKINKKLPENKQLPIYYRNYSSGNYWLWVFEDMQINSNIKEFLIYCFNSQKYDLPAITRQETVNLFLKAIPDTNQTFTTKNVLYENILEYCVYTIQSKFMLANLDINMINTLEEYLPKQIVSIIKQESQSIHISKSDNIYLYQHFPARWRVVYNNLIKSYKDPLQFYDNIKEITALNDKISIKRTIYYKAHLFMVTRDKAISLLLYLHYLSVKSKSPKFTPLAINKSNQKKLFQNKDQKDEYDLIVEKFQKNKSFKRAFRSIKAIYEIKRKTIKLDKKAIKKANKDLQFVINILDPYLTEEQTIVNNDKKEVLTPILTNFIEYFKSNSFQLSQTEIDSFTNTSGIFQSQLIDTINEIYYDQLDDFLIEETNGTFILNKAYYQQITD